MTIRTVTVGDHEAIWGMLEPVIRAGETYALPRDMTRAEAVEYWTGPDKEVFVAESDGNLLGTYYIRANQAGGGAHVSNCGYVTAAAARGAWDRGLDVRAFAGAGAGAGISRDAVQSGGEQQ